MTETTAGVISEQAVIGAALYAPEVAAKLIGKVPVTHFTDPFCRAIWQIFADRSVFHEDVDLATVRAELTEQPQWRDCSARLFDLVQGASPSSVDYHVEQITEAARREAIKAAGQILAQVTESGVDIDEALGMARAKLDEVEQAQGTTGITLEELIPNVLDMAATDTTGMIIPSGYRDLDALVSMRPGQSVVVAARPGVGKSTMGFEIARHVARGRLGEDNRRTVDPVLIVSLEMTRDEVGAKLLAAEAQIPFKSIMDGTMNDQQWIAASGAMPKLAGLPITIDDTPTQSLAQIRQACRRLKPRVVVVDYLQLIRPPKADSREQAVAAISRGLKIIAKECHCLMLVLSQLNRGSAHRKDPRPTMTDLRESGAIEADADTIVLLHRVTESDHVQAIEEQEVIVAKQRGGATGLVTLGFDGRHSRFVDFAPVVEPPRPSYVPASLSIYDDPDD